MNTKTMSVLGSMAVVSAILYVSVLLHVEPLHAADSMVFSNVIIEDGSLHPLALAVTGVEIAQNANVDANINLNPKANMKVSATSSTDLKVGTSTKNMQATSSNSNGVNGNATSTAAVSASTNEDVRAVVESLKMEDRNFADAEIENDEISVKYRQPAKFLGLFPMTVLVTAEIDEDGEIDIDYPWYAFVSKADRDSLRNNLGSQISAVVSNGANATTTPSIAALTPQEKVMLIKAIHTSFKAQMNATSSVDTQ